MAQTIEDFLGPLPQTQGAPQGQPSYKDQTIEDFLGPLAGAPPAALQAAPQSNLEYYGKHLPALVGDKLAEGMANTIGVPGDLEELARPYIEGAFGPQGQGLPTSQDVRQWTGAGSNVQAQNKKEEYLGSAMKALPNMLLAPELSLPKAAGAALASGLGQQVGGDLGSNYGSEGQRVGEALGSIAGGSLSGARSALSGQGATHGIRNMLAANEIMRMFGLEIPHTAQAALDIGALFLKNPSAALKALGPGTVVGTANALGADSEEK